MNILTNATKFALNIIRAILEFAHAIFGCAEKRRIELNRALDAQDSERERALADANAMLIEAARLDHERAEKTKRAAEAAQSEMSDFRIKAIKLAPDASAVLIRLEANGNKFSWRAPIDEDCRFIIDESMPESLIDAIRKTPDPTSTLTQLTKLIQQQVDRLMLEMHKAARRRRAAERDIVEVIPPSGRVEYAK